MINKYKLNLICNINHKKSIMNFKTTLSSLFFTLLLLFGVKGQAQSVDCQFVTNTNGCSDGQYCVLIQIASQDGADYIGSSSIRFSYDAAVLNFVGTSMDGITAGSYQSINFDNDQDSLNPECLSENGGQGGTPYSAHSYDGGTPGDFLVTWVLQVPTVFGDPTACPNIGTDWEDVAEVCFDVLDSEGDPNLQFSGDQNGPVSDLTGTNFNDDHDPPVKYNNGVFGEMHMAQSALCASAAGSCEIGTAFAVEDAPPTISAGCDGEDLVVNISTCNYAGEYATINNLSVGETYCFSTDTGTDVITMYDALDGIALGNGVGTVCVEATVGTLFMQINLEDCGEESVCRESNVTCTSCPAAVCGCTDDTADNYDSNATLDDGSCTFTVVGDECADAVALSIGLNSGLTNANAGTTEGDVEPGCFFNEDVYQSTVWYSFAGNGSTYVITVIEDDDDTLTDTQFALFEGGCDGPQIACNDDISSTNLRSQILLSTEDGVDYYLLVDGFNGSTGTFTIDFVEELPECTLEATFVSGNTTDGFSLSETPVAICGSELGGLQEESMIFVIVAPLSDSNFSPYAVTSSAGTYYDALPLADPVSSLELAIDAFTGNSEIGMIALTDADLGSDVTISFNSLADGSCAATLTIEAGSLGSSTDAVCPALIPGCTDGNATNYNPDATIDDDSCEYPVDGPCGIGTSFGTENSPPLFSADCDGAGFVEVISTCNYAGEYATINNVVVGETYCFSTDTTDIITIYDGLDGLSLASGVTTVCVEATDTTLFMQINTDACGVESVCRVSSMTCTSCLAAVCGCTDEIATNYDSAATLDDDSCEYAMIANDECEGAISLDAGNNGPFVLAGATGNPDDIAGDCFNPADTTYHSIWFTYEGTGEILDLYASGLDDAGNALDSYETDLEFQLFRGTCGALTKVQADNILPSGDADNIEGCGQDQVGDPGDSFFQPQYAFETLAGVTYYVLVDVYGTGEPDGGFYLKLGGSVLGCTNPTADNYDADATDDDGSCTFSTNCGDVFTDSGAADDVYSANETTTTIICPDNAGDPVTVTFTYVDIETATTDGSDETGCWDYLSVYNGSSAAADLVGTYCGEESGDGGVSSIAENNLPVGTTFTSTDASGCLTFVFNSDGTAQETGWLADVTCGGGTDPCDDFPAIDIQEVVSCNDDLGVNTVSLFVTGGASEGDYAISIDGVEVQTGNAVYVQDYEGGNALTLEVTATDLANCSVTETIEVPVCAKLCDAEAGVITNALPSYCSGQEISVASEGFIAASQFAQVYLLVEGDEIVSISSNGIFPDVADGTYTIYPFNYVADNAPAFGEGTNINTLINTTGCFDLSDTSSVNIAVSNIALAIDTTSTCDPESQQTTITFFVSGGSGNYQYQEDDGNLNDTGEAFTLAYDANTTVTISVFDAQTGCSVVESYTVENCAKECDANAGVISIDCDGAVTTSDFQTGEIYSQAYLLTETGSLEIVAISATGDFGDLNAGGYCVYPFNYVTDDVTPMVGQSVTDLVGVGCSALGFETCFSPALEITFEDICNDDTGNHDVTFTFSGGTGNYSLSVDGGNAFDVGGTYSDVYNSQTVTLVLTDLASGCSTTFEDDFEECVKACDAAAGTIATPDVFCVGASVDGLTATGFQTAVQFEQLYVLTLNDVIVAYNTDGNFGVLDAGDYCVHPVNYVIDDGDPLEGQIGNNLTTVLTGFDGSVCLAFDLGCTPVIVSAGPDAVASNDGPVCEGETVNLSATGGVSYAWTGPNGFVSMNQNPSANATGTYTVTITDENGCVATATTEVTVADGPDATASNNGSICEGETATLTATGGVSYSWTGPEGFISNQAEVTTAIGGTYTVTVTDDGGCTATATTDVVISPNPTASATGGETCAGGSVTLGADGGAFYAWTGPNGFVSNEQNPTVMTGGTYTVTVTDANGCTDTATAEVVINPDPAATAMGGSICEGGSIALSATGGVSYAWTGPNGFVSSEQNPNVSTAGTYTVTVTDANGCTATATAIVTLDDSLTVAASNDGPACEGESVMLVASGGSSYAWTGPNGFVSSSQNPSVTDAGTYTVTATSGDCSDSASTEVSFVANPTASATGGETCEGGSVELSADGGSSYAWTGPNGFVSSSQNPTVSDAGTYTVTVTDANGCTDTATAEVIFYDNPNAEAGVEDANICLDEDEDTIELTATGGDSYSWTGPNGFVSSSQNPTLAATVDAAGTYTVTVTDENGCTDTDDVSVAVTEMCNTMAMADIGDTVFFDENGNGVQDAGEPGIAGVTIYVYDEDGNLIETLVTDENGMYLFWGDLGTYTVEVDQDSPALDGLNITTVGSFTWTLTEDGEFYLEADFGFDIETETCDPDAGLLVLTNPPECYDTDYDFLVTAEGNNMGSDYNHVWVMVGTDGIIEEVSFMNGTLQNPHAADTYQIYSYTHDNDCDEPSVGDNFAALQNACNCDDTDGPIQVVVVDDCSTPTGSIGDYVWLDEDGDGVQDAGEEGIEGVTVSLFDDEGNLIATTTTDENGNYLFDDLEAGTYVVEVGDGPDGTELTTSGTDTVDLGEGEDYVNADFGFDTITPGCEADAGTLMELSDGPYCNEEDDILVSAPGNNMGGDYNHVWVMVGSDGIIEEVSFMNGTLQNSHAFDSYEIYSYTHDTDCAEPSTGDSFAALIAACDCYDTDGPLLVTVGLDDACISPPELGSIGDYVWLDDDGDGLQDADEEGIEGVTVSLFDNNGMLIATTVTDEDGGYLFDDLAEGVYVVQVGDGPEGYTLTTSGTDTVDLAEGEDYVNADFGFDAPTTPPTPCEAEAGTLMELSDGPYCNEEDDILVSAPGNNMGGDYNHVWVMVGSDGIIEEVSFMNGTLQNSHAFDSYEIYSYTHDTDCAEPSTGDSFAALIAACDCYDTDGPLLVTVGLDDACISPPELGSIGDYVWLDDDGDGLQDADEEGIEGVTVSLFDNNGMLIATTVTDEDGGYLFDDLAEGVYVVQVGDGPEGYTLTTSGTDTVDLAEGEDYVNADFGFDAPTTPPTPCEAEAGTLMELSDGPYCNEDDDILVSAPGNNMGGDYNHVWVMVGSDGIIEEVSFMNGTLQNPHAFDSYEIYSYTHDNACEEPSIGDNFAALTAACDCYDTDGPLFVTVGLDAACINPPTPEGSIGNYVWFDEDGDGDQDSDEEGIEGVTVSLYQDGDLIATTTTDENGFYLFDNLEAGTYVVEVGDGPDGYELTTSDSDTVNLGENEDYVDADFGFDIPTPTPPTCEADAGTLVLTNPSDCYDTDYDFIVTAAGNNMGGDYNHVWVMVGTDGIIEEVSFMNGTLQNSHAADTYQIYSYTHDNDCDEPSVGDNFAALQAACDCDDTDGNLQVVVVDDCTPPPPTCGADAGTLNFVNPSDCYDTDYDFIVTASGNNMGSDYNHVWVIVGTDGIIEEVSFMNGTLQNPHAEDTYQIYSYTHDNDCDEPSVGDNFTALQAACDCDDTDGPIFVTVEDCDTQPTATCVPEAGDLVLLEAPECIDQDADILVAAPGFEENEDYNHVWVMVGADGVIEEVSYMNGTLQMNHEIGSYEIYSYAHSELCSEPVPGDVWSSIVSTCDCQDIDGPVSVEVEDCTPPPPTDCGAEAGNLVLTNPDADNCYTENDDFIVTASGNVMNADFNHVWVMVGTDGIIEEVSFMNGTLQNYHTPDTYQIYSYDHSTDCAEPDFGDNWNDLLASCDCYDTDGPITVVVGEDGDCGTGGDCEGGASITGDVVDEDGGELSGITIFLYNENGDVIDITYTDDTGEFDFDNLCAGEYTVVVGDANADPITIVVDLIDDEDETVGPIIIVGGDSVTPVAGEPNAGDLVVSQDEYCLGQIITVGAAGNNNSLSQVFVLVEGGDVVAVSFTGGVFGNVAPGDYDVYSVNYDNDEVDAPEAGDDWSDYLGDQDSDYYDVSSSESVEVTSGINIDLELGEECDDEAGTYDVTVTMFGGSGNYTVIDGDISGNFDEGQGETFTANENTTFSVTVIDDLGCTAVAEIYLANCTKTAIELINFDGEAKANGNYLYWATASEYNSEVFEVQHSVDGTEFKGIGEVNAAGNSNVRNDYNFLHTAAPEGISYYRLVEKDLDGNASMTHTIALNRESGDISVISVSPVPALDQVNIEFNTVIAEDAVINVYDVAGRLVEVANTNITTTANMVTIKVSNFPSGTYFLSVSTNEAMTTAKFIKQ